MSSSGEGQGSTFTLRLPLSYRDTSLTPDIEASSLDAAAGKEDDGDRGQVRTYYFLFFLQFVIMLQVLCCILGSVWLFAKRGSSWCTFQT